jgi:hypothetical protein
MYHAAMVMVQIRGVPEDVHKALVRQADLHGQSLNKYLLDELRRIARYGRNEEIFRRAAARKGKVPTGEQIVESIRRTRNAAAGLE